MATICRAGVPNARMARRRGLGLAVLVAGLLTTCIYAQQSQYVGCIKDGPGARAIPMLVEASDTMSITVCEAKARARGQSVFGVEYGRECYAGNDLQAATSSYGTSTSCNMRCVGNSSQTCGGPNAISLYNIPNLAAPTVGGVPYTPQGCWTDAAGAGRRMTALWSDPKMNIDFCAQLAKSEGYSIFGLQYFTECWGSNDFAHVMALGRSQGCNSPCEGNKAQICGGSNALSVYNISSIDAAATQPSPAPAAGNNQGTASPSPAAGGLPAGVTKLGCYKDTWERLLPNQLAVSQTMTIQQCSELAKAARYPVFALQYTAECWAGTDVARATSGGTSTDCNMNCYNADVGSCGGPMANTVYTVVLPQPPAAGTLPPAPAGLVLPDGVTAQGCFKDTAARQLPNQVGNSPTMTVKTCSDLAKAAGFAVFGIQYTAECWAGNDFARATSQGTSKDCNMQCYQMPLGNCGGPMANSIYTQTLPTTTTPTPPAGGGQSGTGTGTGTTTVQSDLPITSLGCFADKFPPDRALVQLEAAQTMTVDRCAKLAYGKGYTVIGLQYAQECWASTDEAQATRWGPSNNCNSACYSDPPKTCGGGLANSLYRLPPLPAGQTPATPPPVVVEPQAQDPQPQPQPQPQASPPPAVPAGQLSSLNITSLGCFADNFASRALPMQLKVSQTMTVDECAQLAWANARAGFTVFGVQYGQECYAGRNETHALSHGPSTGCNSVCYDPTNPVGSCGGGLANSVYRLPYRAPPPPPPPSPYNETFIGCYKDGAVNGGALNGGHDRTLETLLGNDPSMTIAFCAGLARKAEFTVFAVQYGQECRGSWDLDLAKALGPSDDCQMPCPGNYDQTCGGPNANSLYTIEPPPKPADLPAYTYLGCYTDDQVFDMTQDPPTPIKRRMWRRLGQWPTMETYECARRAKAAGYPLFGMTAGEVWPAYGRQCWGAFNLTHVTALGKSDKCTDKCKNTPWSEVCGGNYAISLYQLDGVEYDTGAGGHYQYLLEMPVSGAHLMQVTSQDNFLVIDFLDFDHPKTWDGRNTTYMYHRANNTFRPINNIRDASCGQWHRMPDGDLMGFSGYFGASGVNEVSVWATMWYHRHGYNVEDFGEKAMPFGRWYGGTVLMPDGRSYVTGGDLGPGTPRALGADVWDPAHKTWTGRYNNMGENAPYLPLNKPLFDASTVGGYYPGLWVLPSGAYLFAQSQTVQVINPLTGEALAAAPPLPRDNYWEYPLSGSQVVLRTPVLTPNSKATFAFMVFSGSNQAAYYKPCSDFSLRIPVEVDCTSMPCTHAFGQWELETMIGHRGMLDTAVLPNGKVLLINGVEEGLSNLESTPNGNNVPVNEPWIYDPDAPAGQRYRRTGAYTNIARFYHGSAVMTSYGDVLVSGSTIAKYFTSYHLADFNITPYEMQEFRIELFKPHYILGPRPTWAFVPTMVSYNEAFIVKLATNTTASDVATVVLGDPGTTTHSSNMATRMQELAWEVVDDHTLRVTAPANSFLAQPTFYHLYLVGKDDSYSVGEWIKLRGPWGSVPLSLPHPSEFSVLASTRAESEYVSWSVSAAGADATLETQRAEAAGSGQYGLTLTAGSSAPIILAGPALEMQNGTRVHTFLWARAPADDVVRVQHILLNSADEVAGYKFDRKDDYVANIAKTWQQFPMGGLVPNVTGYYRPALKISGMKAGMTLHIDDIEVFTLTAADYARSLQMARDGIEVGDQLGAEFEIPGALRKLRELLPFRKSKGKSNKAQRGLKQGGESESAEALANLPEPTVDNGLYSGYMGMLSTPSLESENADVQADLEENDRKVGDPLQGVVVKGMTHRMKGHGPPRIPKKWPIVENASARK